MLGLFIYYLNDYKYLKTCIGHDLYLLVNSRQNLAHN